MDDKKFIRKKELDRLYKYLLRDKVRGPTRYAIVYLGAALGLRITEVAHMRIEDFRDLKNGRVIVRVAKKKRRDRRKKVDPLSRPEVVQLVSDQVIRKMLNYFKWRGINYKRQKGWLFEGRHPVKPISVRYIHKFFTECCEECGIGHKTFHSLRHYLGFKIQRETGDLTVTKAFLRHADVATTQVYTQRTPDELREIANRIGGAG